MKSNIFATNNENHKMKKEEMRGIWFNKISSK